MTPKQLSTARRIIGKPWYRKWRIWTIRKEFRQWDKALVHDLVPSYLDKAYKKMEVFDPDGATFEAVDNRTQMYNNVLANCNTMIRFNMLLLDRGNDDNAESKIFKAIRSMPEQGVFPESFMERFRMKIQVVPEVGDRVLTTNHGQGVLLLHVGGKNWNVRLTDNKEIILNENQFKLL